MNQMSITTQKKQIKWVANKRMEEVRKMVKIGEFVREIMKEMEKRGFSEGEARHCAKMLDKEITENSKRNEYHKPFTVFEHPTECSD